MLTDLVHQFSLNSSTCSTFLFYNKVSKQSLNLSHVFFIESENKYSLGTDFFVVLFESITTKGFLLTLKVALQILQRKVYKNTKKSSLYSQSLLIFLDKTPVVENHLITREIKDLLWPRSTPTGNTVYFYMSSSFIYILEIHKAQTYHPMKTLWKIITCLLCYQIYAS